MGTKHFVPTRKRDKLLQMLWLFGLILLSKLGCGSAAHSQVVDVVKCPDSPLKLGNSPWRIEIPSYPFAVNLTLRQSTQTFFFCSGNPGVEEVPYYFTTMEDLEELELEFGPQQAKTFLMGKVYMTPQGVLAVDHAMYQTDEFCLYNYTHTTSHNSQPELIFRVCPNNCNSEIPGIFKQVKNEPCIKKCCPMGMAVDFSAGFPDCMPSFPPERDFWEGKFYDSRTWKRMSPTREEKLRPHYHHHILSSNCTKFETWFGKEVKQMNVTNPKQSARLLSDGSIIYISGNRRWEVLVGVDFCIDGMQNVENDEEHKDGLTSSAWPESEQVLIICATDFKSAKSRDQSILYMCFLFGATFFYWMTALVHGLLWEKQNSNGWTMFCLTLTMGFWSVFMGNAHRLGLNGDSALRKSVVCVSNAILAHFFMLAAFTWLTIINYSIWSTFRTLTPRNDGKNLKQLIKFMVVGFGCPLIVVLVGVTLEQVYPDKESLVIIPEYGQNICFVAEYAQGVYIYYILGFLFLIIIILSGLTCFKLHQFQQDTAKVRSSSSAGDRSMAQLYAKLSVVLGITWAFEFISWAFTYDGQSWFWAFPDLYNLLTSVIIFFIYVCKPSTIQQMEQKFPQIKPVSQAVGRFVAAARETFQSEPGSNTTASSSVYLQNSFNTGKNANKSEVEMSGLDISKTGPDVGVPAVGSKER